MKAMQVAPSQAGSVLHQADVPRPIPGAGDLLIRVHAAGVTPSELGWYPTTHVVDGSARINAIPGHEFSGVVEAVGTDIEGFSTGDAVFGMNDWFADGATAEFCLAQPSAVALKPATLTHEEAATVPIAALTAWQGLFDHAALQPHERVLVHGGAGSVGTFAVQLAHRHGAHVLTTVSPANTAFVTHLGADEAIDYTTQRFEDRAKDIDVVFDTVGGETRDRSWQLLRPGGRMISIAADGESSTDPRIRETYFIVKPSVAQLTSIARQVDAGAIRTFVDAVVPFEQAPAAYARHVPTRRGYGKVVVTIAS